jgi:hypothetical protein
LCCRMKRKKREKENSCVGVSDLCELHSSAILSLSDAAR